MIRTQYRQWLFASACLLAISTSTMGAEPTTADLQKAVDSLNQATTELKKLQAELQKIPVLETSIDDNRRRLIKLENDIKMLTESVESLKAAKKSTSLRPDNTATKGMGRFRLINDFVEEQSVLVNGVAYRLLPGEERVIPVAAGEFSYQVLQVQRRPQVRQISVDEIKTVRIYPVD
ncbi:MAG: hypothetical protein R3B84_11740 [Zavarzinella sp.]